VIPTNTLRSKSATQYFQRRETIKVFDKDTTEVGKITKAVFNSGQPKKVSVDAALVEITDRHPNDGYFSDVYSENQMSGAGM
jgi:hypothetical protein